MKEKFLQVFNAKEIENIEKEDIDLEKSLNFIKYNLFFLKNNIMVLEEKEHYKDVFNPNIIKVKDKENVKFIYVLKKELFNKIKEFINSHTNISLDVIDNENSIDDEELTSSAIDQLIFDFLYAAKNRHVSDVHILPKKKKTIIKFRDNGSLLVYKTYKKEYCKYIVNRIKTKANLDITNSKTPQDGKFKTKVDQENLEIRVSTANTIFGENTVLRIQQTDSLFDIALDDLGFEKDDLETYRKSFHSPYGMILNVGATGQGKTTTFYLTIKEMIELFPDKAISTAEDPVEIIFEPIQQFEVNDIQGLTFAVVLRALLRQDPDIIMIGEIRDEETAQIAVKASMTGHLVLATLHATDSANAFSRLKDIGVSNQQIASTISCIISQRLVRALCPKCKKQIPVNSFLREEYHLHDIEYIYEKGEGCNYCNNTGFKGRKAIVEVLDINNQIKSTLSEGDSEVGLKKVIKSQGFQNLWKNALKKVKRGETSIAEIERVVKPDSIYDND